MKAEDFRRRSLESLDTKDREEFFEKYLQPLIEAEVERGKFRLRISEFTTFPNEKYGDSKAYIYLYKEMIDFLIHVKGFNIITDNRELSLELRW